jgi:nucleotide-binding universal stress UspA family protein
MTYKTIAVSLNDIEGREALIAAALKLGQAFEAHVTGVYVVPAVEVYPTGGVDLMPQVFEGTRLYFQGHAAATKAAFEAAMEREGVGFGFEEIDSSSTLIADDTIAAVRSADLALMRSSAQETTGWIEADLAERVVIGAGRPVLLLPRQGQTELAAGPALVGWNGSREAARAAFDAVPLLKLASEVKVVTVDPASDPTLRGQIPGAGLAEALARHGIKATTEPYQAGGVGAGEALLRHGKDEGASLIVIGAYGHSRLREFILGGATLAVLAGFDRPVLMSH